MAKAELQGLITDVRRLLDEGGRGAAGDAGLRRRGEVLRGLAAQVPALAPVASAVEAVFAAPANRTVPALCDLLQVARQVGAGLTAGGVEGKLEPVAASGPWQTAAAVRDVVAWSEASFTDYGGDAAVSLRKAVQRPDFADLRLVDPLLRKLATSSGYSNVDLLADVALPAYGKTIVPLLEGGFKIKGGVEAGRRLRALCKLDAKRGEALCRQAAAEGSSHVKAAGLRQLQTVAPREAERVALTILAGKASYELATAALEALAASTEDEALETLLNNLYEEEYIRQSTAAEVLAKLPHPRATERLLAALDERLKARNDLVAAAKAKKGTPPPAKGKGGKKAAAAPNFQRDLEFIKSHINDLISILGNRRDAAAVPALTLRLKDGNSEVREAALLALSTIGAPESLEVAVPFLNDRALWEVAVPAVWKLPATRRYDLLAPLVEELSKGKKADHKRGRAVLAQFEREFLDNPDDDDEWDDFDENEDEDGPSRQPKAPRTDWDPRWTPLLRQHLGGPYRSEAALALAVVLGPKAVPELMAQLPASIKKNECGVAEALGYLKAREAIPALVPLMAGQPTHHYCIHDALKHINDPSAIPLVEDLIGKTKDVYRNYRLQSVINYLKRQEGAAP